MKPQVSTSLPDALARVLDQSETTHEDSQIVVYDPLFRESSEPIPTGGPRYFRTTLLPLIGQGFASHHPANSLIRHISTADCKRPLWQLFRSSRESPIAIIPTSEDPRVAWPACAAAILARRMTLLPIMHCIPPPHKRLGPRVRNVVAFINQRTLILVCNLFRFPLLAINEHTGEQLRSLAPRSKTLVIPPLVHSTKIGKKRRLGERSGITLICIGRQAEHKGSLELPYIARELTRRGICFQLHIVGDEETHLRKNSNRLANRLNVSNLLIRHGRVSELEKSRLLATADVLINPSHEEGYSYVVEEAVSAGVPAVMWDLPEMLSVWRGQPSVHFAARYDVEAFVTAIIGALDCDDPSRDEI